MNEPTQLTAETVPPANVAAPAAWAVWCEVDERAQSNAEMVRLRGESPIAATRRRLASFEHLSLASAWAKAMVQTIMGIHADALDTETANMLIAAMREAYAEQWGNELVAKMEASWLQAFNRACEQRRETLAAVEARRVAHLSTPAPEVHGEAIDEHAGQLEHASDAPDVRS